MANGAFAASVTTTSIELLDHMVFFMNNSANEDAFLKPDFGYRVASAEVSGTAP